MSKRLYSNLLRQNCYVRDASDSKDLLPCHLADVSYYVSLDEKIEDDGIKVVPSVQRYDITPEGVASYAPGCDYKQNLEEALSAPPRLNIGDIRDLQKLTSSDYESMYKTISELKERLDLAKTEALKNKGGETDV